MVFSLDLVHVCRIVMPLYSEVTLNALEGQVNDLRVARNEVFTARIGLGDEVGDLLGMGLSNSTVGIPANRPDFILESRLTREVLGHGNKKSNLPATREDPAVLQVLRWNRRVVHGVLDDVMITILVVDWNDRAGVAEVSLQLVEVNLGEVGGEICNSWSSSGLLGSGSTTRRSLLPGGHVVGSSVGFKVLDFGFVNLGVFGTEGNVFVVSGYVRFVVVVVFFTRLPEMFGLCFVNLLSCDIVSDGSMGTNIHELNLHLLPP